MSKEETKQRMLNSIPRYYTDSPEATAIIEADAEGLTTVREDIRDVLNQFFIRTATWGLEDWERVLALTPAKHRSMEYRRQRILARLNGTAPVTVEYLTDLVNSFTENNDAKIVPYNKDYRFEAVIPTRNEIDTDLIYEVVNDVKPAHLVFELVGLSDMGEIIVKPHFYNFPVEYRITNTFHTADVGGGLGKAPIELQEKTYAVDVLYPITNTFNTSAITVEDEQINVMLTEEYRNNDILYKRVGDTQAGEGVI